MANNPQRQPSECHLHLRLYEVRTAKGVRLDELAEAVGLKKRALYYFESGERYPSLTNLWLIAEALGVTVDDLLS